MQPSHAAGTGIAVTLTFLAEQTYGPQRALELAAQITQIAGAITVVWAYPLAAEGEPWSGARQVEAEIGTVRA